MAIRALNSAIVANYDTYANATIFAGDALMLDSNGKVIPAHRSHTSFDTGVEQAGRFVGFSADDTVRSGNTMILADPVGASYIDSSNNLVQNTNAFYVVSKRAIGDFLAENVNGVTNPTAGSSGFEGPRRGVAVFNTPGGQFVTDRWHASTTSGGTATSDLAGWTPAIGDLLAVAGGAGQSGKLVQFAFLTGSAVGTSILAFGRVDSYDSATGLLYFTQLGPTGL